MSHSASLPEHTQTDRRKPQQNSAHPPKPPCKQTKEILSFPSAPEKTAHDYIYGISQISLMSRRWHSSIFPSPGAGSEYVAPEVEEQKVAFKARGFRW